MVNRKCILLTNTMSVLTNTMSVITSLADPYHFDTVTDPDRGPEKIRNGSGFRRNFDTGPDPDGTLIRIRIRIQAKTIRIRIQAKKNSVP